MQNKLSSLKTKHLLLAIALVNSGTSVFSYADNKPHTAQANILDWVPIEALTDAQKEALSPGSCGAYISPIRKDSEAELDPSISPIRAAADQSQIFQKDSATDNALKNSHIILIGDVLITQGYRQLKAQRAELDQSNNSLVLEGELELREPGILVLGKNATFSQAQTQTAINTKTTNEAIDNENAKNTNTLGSLDEQSTPFAQNQSFLSIESAQYVLQEQGVRGTAEQINKTVDNELTLSEASFTQCEPGNNTWLLKGSQIVLDTEARQGHARHVKLLVKDIPILYLPYIRFPLGSARLSGFLSPTISYSDSEFNVAVPYYFNLAPNYDFLFTPNYLGAHGLLYGGKFRHLNRHFESELNLGYINNDKGQISDDDQALVVDGLITEAELVPFKDEDRWVVNFNQTGGSGKAWSTAIDYTDVSDIDYFDDFDNNTAASRDDDYLNQHIQTGYQTEHWQIGLNAIRYELLNDNISIPYRQVPAITADGDYQLSANNQSNWALSLNNEWIEFDHDNADDSNPILTGQRFRAEYSLEYNYEPEWGFIRPKLQTKHLQYWLNDNNFTASADKSPSISVPQLVFDAGLFFERDGKLGNQGYLQTFEPHLFYFYSDFEDQSKLFDLTTDGQDIDFDTAELTFSYSQLFRDTRFSGGDRIDDANQLAVGLTTRFFGNQSGREWFSASIGQIRYFEDRKVTLNNTLATNNNSLLAAQFSANPSEYWRISSDFLYNDIDHELERGTFSLRFQGETKHLFNLSYRYVRGVNEDSTIKQLDGAIIAPLINQRWHLLLYSAYDTLRNRELDTLAAIEYSGCCYKVRVGYRSELDKGLADTLIDRDLDYDYSAFFEIHFKGLGGSSKQLDNILTDNIDGYTQWQAIYQD